MLHTVPQRKGVCDICDSSAIITVFQGRGYNIWLCKDHYQSEMEAIQSQVQTKQVEQTLLDKSRHIDSLVELSQDLCNAQTVPFMQLKAEVDNNPNIPDDQKDFAFVQICAERIAQFSHAIQSKEAALVEEKNARFYWIKNAQEIVGRLRATDKAKIKPFDVSYPVKAPKTIKSKPVKASANQSTSTFNRQELKDASEKHSIPADKIRMYCLRHPGLSADAAAKKLVELGWS